MEHIFNAENEIKSFKTKSFLKEIAKISTFLHSRLYHPQNVFKGIITGEVQRLNRLNENDFKESLLTLEKKCIRSKFNPKLVKGQLEF